MSTVLITGIGHGIGKAIAEKFFAEGWAIIGTSTTGSTDIQEKNLTTYQLDLADEHSIAEFVRKMTLSGAKIDMQINNAGINPGVDKEKVDIAVLRRTIEINLLGLITITESLLDTIIDTGVILNISSTAGLISSAMQVPMTAYRISKAGVNMYTHTLAQRLRSRGIIVSAYNPGWVRTRMGGDHASKSPAQAAEEIFTFVTTNKGSGYFWDEGRKN